MIIGNNMLHNTNVDQQEITKFAALAEKWWDPDGEFKPLHDINPLRLSFIQQHCSLTGKKILDVGCGGGILAETMASCGGIVTGIDMAESVLQAAKIHADKQHLLIDYLCTTVEALTEQQREYYDVITCMELLEHVPDPSSIVASCSQLIKPNGALFFSTINRNLKSYLYAIIGAEYLLKLLPKGTHHYEKFIRPSELSHWMFANNIQMQALTGISYNPLSKYYYLNNDDIDVNYLAYCQKSVE